MTGLACRICGATPLGFIGRLPDQRTFAGQTLPHLIDGGALMQCSSCYFVCREPLLSQTKYGQLYGHGTSSVWDSDQPRIDFELVHKFVVSNPEASRVLDIGCYTGRLLASLPRNVEKFGIEPNQSARDVATTRNVKLLGNAITDLVPGSVTFDVISLCDVIEHVMNPLEFLSNVSSFLAPHGAILISTGDGDSWLWKLCGSSFWYCAYAEHISFVGRRWFNKNLGKIGLNLQKVESFNYLGGNIRPLRASAAILYRVAPRAYFTFKSIAGKSSDRSLIPGAGATRDHIFCVLKRHE